MSVYVQTNQPIPLVLNQAAYACSSVDTGKLFLIGIQGQALTITLPALAAGLHYRFQTAVGGVAMAFDVIVRAVAATNLSGLLCIAANNPAAITAQTSCTFVAAAPCAVGDFVDCYCDGVQWSVIACSSLAGGITSP